MRWNTKKGNKQNSHRHKLPIMISGHTCAHIHTYILTTNPSARVYPLSHARSCQSSNAKNTLQIISTVLHIYDYIRVFISLSLFLSRSVYQFYAVHCDDDGWAFNLRFIWFDSSCFSFASTIPFAIHIIICRFVLIFDQRNKLMVCKREHATHIRYMLKSEISRIKYTYRKKNTKSTQIGLFLSFRFILFFLMSLLRNEYLLKCDLLYTSLKCTVRSAHTIVDSIGEI